VNEAVDRLIAERERLDSGLSGSLLVSIAAHLTFVGLAVALPLLLPRGPVLRVADGFAVVLPRGGGGSPAAVPPARAPQPQAPAAPAAPPKVLKPPTEAPRPHALPAPDSRRTARRPAEPATTATRREPGPKAPSSPAGAGSATPGLEFGPPGPGVPDGTDAGGDWYLAGVQQKIWMLWNQQIKAGFTQPIGVTFTILADGSVADVHVTQPSGATLLDMAAHRAIVNAAPFGPLPRQYGTNRKTIQAIFRPTS
jgi:TonB family protein